MPPVSVVAETIEKIIHSHICNVFQMTANIVSLLVYHRPAAKVKRHNEIGVRQIGIDNASDNKHSTLHSISLSDDLALVKSVVQVAYSINLATFRFFFPFTLPEKLSTPAKVKCNPHNVQIAIPQIVVGVVHGDRVAGDH